ncbi:SDR family NAD(P)-dependent oxidoreductase [Gordonia sp. DT30]|uniref:SDR family NAD(P)-dependent oxidoreductase n=1 Tax=Gordonia sp. DT30 TaxID=3416546 RepID=UPI003CF29755
MTGATRGIGLAAARHILSTTGDVHLALLSRGRMDELPTGLAAYADRITMLPADLTDATSIDGAIATLVGALDAATLPPLSALGLNAGIQFVDALHATGAGLETTFAVNVVANHLLIMGLREHLRIPARITITVSDTHFGDFRHTGGLVPAPRWSAPRTLAAPGAFADPASTAAGRTAYSTSKLAALHLVHEWARHLPAGLDIVSYNPSLVPGTGLTRDARALDRFAGRWVLPALSITPLVDRIPTAGVKLADAILARTAAGSGEYIDRTRVVPSSPESYDPQRERELWDFLEELRRRVPAGPDNR